jgi:probable rRNA maturation factor
MIEISFIDDQDQVTLDHEVEALIEACLLKALQIEGIETPVEVSVVFVDDPQIAELNRTYRGKEGPTDVLSFPQEEDPHGMAAAHEVLILGDIVLSVERAVAQAKAYDHPLEREIAYLATHSIFHLLGYDHMEAEDKRVMREKEEAVLSALGILRETGYVE